MLGWISRISCWSIARGKELAQLPGYRTGVNSRWLWGDLDSLLLRLRARKTDWPAQDGRGRLRAICAVPPIVRQRTCTTTTRNGMTWRPGCSRPATDYGLRDEQRSRASQAAARQRPTGASSGFSGSLISHPWSRWVRSYVRDAWWEARGPRCPQPDTAGRCARTLLFVCKGNICRSPFAAIAATRRLARSRSRGCLMLLRRLQGIGGDTLASSGGRSGEALRRVARIASLDRAERGVDAGR